MVDLWSKCPIQKLWQIFKSISMQNSTFFWGPQLFFLFSFSPVDLFNWKKDLNWKIVVSRFLRSRPNSALTPANLRVRDWPASPLPRHRHWQMGPACQLSLPPKFPLLRVRVSSPATRHHPTPQGGPRVRLPPWAVVSAAVGRGVPSPLRRWSAATCHCSSRDAAPGARRRSLVPPAPLAELMWPKARRLDLGIALATRARSR
jgi:hypothetical protein